MEVIAKFLEFMKVGARYFFGIACAMAIILFAPDSIINRFGFLEYREQSKLYFGISLLICIAIIIADFIGITRDFIRKKYSKYLFFSARNKRLHNLTAEEKDILNAYIGQQTKTQYFDCRDGVVKGLVHDVIIYRSSNISLPSSGIEFAYNIQPWAWEYLNENTNLLSHKN